eukprot:CAMPEP_0204203340 /NCGR_PEP_ID=MMETSP0361-20130328/68873_1 /ASSEMBLY_ACC=CAM_ASM_000343 /TAXON_ID=268821 /ORGANISM="Scrippsiella Hangoei, Strain SHTV-5" /LENGTH=115 /DNA_ID=CAMNT_0051166287 /DNA_START=1 /DNA_END=348 /DNA_ORIENTATION=-
MRTATVRYPMLGNCSEPSVVQQHSDEDRKLCRQKVGLVQLWEFSRSAHNKAGDRCREHHTFDYCEACGEGTKHDSESKAGPTCANFCHHAQDAKTRQGYFRTHEKGHHPPDASGA